MISRVCGVLTDVTDSIVTVDVVGVGYSIFVSESLARELLGHRGEETELYTYYYLQGSGLGNALPTLIGFRSRLDREFFEQFITVSGIGPKAAVRALTLPVAEIAAAIEAANSRVLQSLPGIGKQRATEIIAKLQGKVAKFAMAPVGEAVSGPVAEDVAEEARL
ncbi:MAG: Holliday junction DNA helicase RuvA, partial [Planctomycetes bacterium]|nr:Holliday junction DNA helicase RuvA [Planctomycetota bacterium]